MKRLLSVILFCPFLLGAQNKIIDHKISQVTIFLNGVNLKSDGSVFLKKGKHTLEFRNLSESINSSTIRIGMDKGGVILGINNKKLLDPKDELTLKKIDEKKDSIASFMQEISRLKYQLDIYKEEKSLLHSNKSRVGSNQSISVQELKQAADFYRERLGEIEKLIAKDRLELGNKESKLSDITKRHGFLVNGIKKRKNAAVLSCEVEQDGMYHFELEYYCKEAAWKPTYNVRCNSISEPISIEYEALVKNMTGKDWEDVQVILSTADPLLSNKIPEMEPWSLNYSSKYKLKKERDLKYVDQTISGYTEGNDRSSNGTAVNKQFTVIDVSAVSTNFTILKKHSIPADSSIHQVQISSGELETTYEHLAIPKANMNVFIIAKAKGWESLNLISGDANIYFAGEYVGKTFLELDQTEDELSISLGHDKKVIVERKKREDLNSKKFIGTNRKVTLAYELSVKNTHSEQIKLKLQDQVPISQESNILVEVKEISGAEQDELSGTLTWDLTLEPQESVKKILKVEVKYPRNKMVLIRKPQYARTRF